MIYLNPRAPVVLAVGVLGPQGIDGIDGVDGSPDTAAQIRDKLVTLTGGDRLPSSAIDGIVAPSDRYRVPPTAITGSTSEVLIATLTFPGGFFAEGDFVRVDGQFGRRASVSGTASLRINFEGNANNRDLLILTSNNQNRQIQKNFSLTDGSYIMHPDQVNPLLSSFASLTVENPIDLSQPSYLRVFATLTNAADTYWLNQFFVTRFRSSLTVSSPGGSVGGGSSGSGAIAYTAPAGQLLSALRVACIVDGEFVYATPTNPAHASLPLWFVAQSFAQGAIATGVNGGLFEDESWSWGEGAIWLGSNGTLTQTPSFDWEFLRQVAEPIDATSLIFKTEESTIL